MVQNKCINMSLSASLKELTLDERKRIGKDLTINIKPSHFNPHGQIKSIYIFKIENKQLYIPFHYARSMETGKEIKRKTFSKYNVNFTGELRENQKKIKDEVFEHIRTQGSSIIAAYPGCGKTCIGIYIATKLRVKTLIVTHRIVLINQWKKSILKFCGSEDKSIVQVVDSKTKELDPKAFFYIINATTVVKKTNHFFRTIGFVVVDECHLIMAESLSKSMFQLSPRYVLGLSATPYREDGLNILLELFFGKKQVYRKLERKHVVYRVNTGFEPEVVKHPMTNKVVWGKILDQQAHHEPRNRLIVSIVKRFKDRNFLILCKRVKQGKELIEMIREEKIEVTSLIGKQQTFDVNCRVLVGTSSKAGVGFDHPKLNALILAGDIQAYFVQYLGRVLRTPDVEPIIFDLVDKNKTLERHFKNRQKIYKKHGGVVQLYS